MQMNIKYKNLRRFVCTKWPHKIIIKYVTKSYLKNMYVDCRS